MIGCWVIAEVIYILFADVSDICSDADLTAIYLSQSVQGQFSKRRRSDSCELDETEVEKENR